MAPAPTRLKHSLAEVRQPKLTLNEQIQLFGVLGDPLVKRELRVWAEVVLIHLRDHDARLHFTGNLRESYHYQLWNRYGDLPIARLGSKVVLLLLQEGLIDEQAWVTDKGETFTFFPQTNGSV